MTKQVHLAAHFPGVNNTTVWSDPRDKASGVFLADPTAGRFARHDRFFDISGRFNVPRSPQGRPDGPFRAEYEGSTLRDHLGLEPLKAAS